MKTTRQRLATEFPCLDPRWAEDLLVALRIREVSGARIGEILAEADEHCASTGQGAAEAFGPAGDYAASLDFAGQQRAPQRVTAGTLAGVAASLVGGGVATWGGTALIEGTTVALRAAELAVTVLLLLAAGLTYRRLEWVLRHIVLASLAFGVWMAGFVALFVWGGPTLGQLAAGPTFVVGLVLLLGPALAATPGALRAPVDDVVPPGAPRDARSGRVIALVTLWFLPAAILAILAAHWLLASRP